MVDGLSPVWGVLRRPPSRLVADTVVVMAITGVLAGLTLADQLILETPPVADAVLALLATAAAAAAAILAVIVAHLIADARQQWIAAALTAYAVIVLPTTALLGTGATAAPLAGVRVVGYVATILLLIGAVRPPRRSGVRVAWFIVGLGVLGSMVALLSPTLTPALLRAESFGGAVLIGWTAAAAAVVVEGYRRNSTPRWRVGLGLVVLSLAQFVRTVEIDASLFGVLRLFGLVVVLAGFAQMLRRTMADLADEQSVHQQELVSAAVHMDRAAEIAAERDHELRNGLAGLAGIAHLLSRDGGGEDQRRLQHAVLAELGRLHNLLDGAPTAEVAGSTAYAVEPVLAGLVALRRSTGVDIRLAAEDRLAAVGSSAVLAQVVVNVLANCDRHAAGAPIVVRSYRADRHAVIEIRDEGPGLLEGRHNELVERGTCDPAAGGRGLGLFISKELIEGEGGSLHLDSVGEPSGCRVRISVPAAGRATPA